MPAQLGLSRALREVADDSETDQGVAENRAEVAELVNEGQHDAQDRPGLQGKPGRDQLRPGELRQGVGVMVVQREIGPTAVSLLDTPDHGHPVTDADRDVGVGQLDRSLRAVVVLDEDLVMGGHARGDWVARDAAGPLVEEAARTTAGDMSG